MPWSALKRMYIYTQTRPMYKQLEDALVVDEMRKDARRYAHENTERTWSNVLVRTAKWCNATKTLDTPLRLPCRREAYTSKAKMAFQIVFQLEK
jgi:hypothetical protein